MKTWYCVTTAFYDNGRVVAAITDTKEAEKKPESTCSELRSRDVYNDWFGSVEEAKAFVEEAKIA